MYSITVQIEKPTDQLTEQDWQMVQTVRLRKRDLIDPNDTREVSKLRTLRSILDAHCDRDPISNRVSNKACVAYGFGLQDARQISAIMRRAGFDSWPDRMMPHLNAVSVTITLATRY
ncbi:hypothetical protein [Bifidobacterium xylocopae]|uniref:Uncharacterized protein n=1 Tax=Bifidobacterium xylocopae TaxID=2493119 RepID=A0A366KAR3_9BIFI|nr:hypothetical protein [Bifidobacterium xylocopae]RBP98825.1 hypothetical protein CRD59_06965 [Bifidobacterium xylocopae]